MKEFVPPIKEIRKAISELSREELEKSLVFSQILIGFMGSYLTGEKDGINIPQLPGFTVDEMVEVSHISRTIRQRVDELITLNN